MSKLNANLPCNTFTLSYSQGLKLILNWLIFSTAFVKACIKLGINPKQKEDIFDRLGHEDTRQQFATMMAEKCSVHCELKNAEDGCILLELEVPTEEDRLQLLRMARDGTFQQVLLETFLPEFAAEGRAVSMNLAIGVRNPSQDMVEELQGATASKDNEDVVLVEIPEVTEKQYPTTDDSKTSTQSEELGADFDKISLTCSVCMNTYNDPRILPCLHTFCADCLEQWRKGNKQFTCPTCRQQVTLPGTDVSSLPPHFYIKNLQDLRALQNSIQANESCQMCESGARVEGRCGDCHFHLCKSCIAIHSKTPALQDHYIITLHDLKNPSSQSKLTRTQYSCPRHKDQRMTFYCLPCAKLVCQACTVAEHRPGVNHDPQEVNDVAQKFKAELQTLVEKTEKTAAILEETDSIVSKELTSITENCELEIKKIQVHFEELRAKLEKAEQEVTDKLKKMGRTQKEPLLEEKQDVGSNNPVLRFGQKSRKHGQFDKPRDVAVKGNRLYVADNGKLINRFPLGEYCTHPYGLAVQRDGRVVVADKDKHSIFLFEADGKLAKQVGGKGQGEGQFNEPCFVCVDKEDYIIVADKNNHRVQVFDQNLNFKHKFGQKGRQPQDMWYPFGVSADSRGNIVLANSGSNVDGTRQGQKLQVFRLDGTWVATISSDGDKPKRPHGVAVTEDGHVFVADPDHNCIRKYRYI
ncbi:TRIM2 [Branchiostoma lanceolatum]|uniref:RING-type E3 ubiquitin transferase n=1 Tax=Branchiostoma lanceolatum TaxID=7740 RepID=A0A8J9Z238_BRALA|nr:TRIM2 [Branchiostoma lanceolatum]